MFETPGGTMNERYAANLSLVHRADGTLYVSVFCNPIDGCAEEMTRLEYTGSAPEESEDWYDWFKQALEGAREGL